MRTQLRTTTALTLLLGSFGLAAAGACSSDDESTTPSTVTVPNGGNTTTSSTSNTGATAGTGGSSSGGSTSTGGNGTGGTSAGGSLPGDTSVIFLHHSTGGVIWGGGVASAIADHNSSNATSYTITELAYPDGESYPWANYPYDYWHFWVDGGGQAGTYGDHLTIEELTSTYDVVVFKHCYPVSGISADTGSPDISSDTKSIENYQLQYDALKDRLHGFPNNRFIVWTGAALVAAGSSTEQGTRARQFFTWVKDVWDEDGDNIFVWDFFELETEGGNFLLDQYSANGGTDSHPSAAFASTVAPFFAQRIVDVIEGRGDTGSLTGE